MVVKVEQYQDKEIQSFAEYLKQGIEFIQLACNIYVQAITNDPTKKEKFVEAFPEITASGWARFEDVGRGLMYAGFLTTQSHVTFYLKRLPLSDQKTLANGKVCLMLPNGDNLMVDVRTLTPAQAKQVFAYNHVRDLPEQRAYLESLKKVADVPLKQIDGKPYRILKNGTVNIGGVIMTKNDLLRIAMEIG